MKNLSLLLVLLSLFALNMMGQTIEPNLKWGKPTDEELTMTEYSLDKDAEAVELYRLVEVDYWLLDGSFKVVNRIKGRVKVLKDEGKELANGSITFREDEGNSAYKEAVIGLKAMAYNMVDGKLTKTKMESSMIFEERLDKNQKRIKFSVPQVKVGTVIEYEYRIESDFYNDLRDWYAQKEIPVLYSKYVLTVPEWFSFSIDQTGAHSIEHQKSYGSIMVGSSSITTNKDIFIARNLPALKGDDYVWHVDDYGCKVTHELKGIYVPGEVHKDYTSSWEDIEKILLDDEDFGGRIKKSSPLKSEIVSAGIPAITDPTERVAAVWKLLKSKVRWDGKYAFWAKSGSKVLKEGTGSNADINFLFINMLRDAGVDAEPVVLRLRSKGHLPLTHASLKYLSTFVVAITMNDSSTAYFDASSEDGFLNVLPSVLLVDKARAIRKDHSAEWVNLQDLGDGKETTVVQAKISDSGLISGQYVSTCYGNAAAILRKKWRTAQDSTKLIHEMQEENSMEISSHRQEGRDSFSPSMQDIFDFTKQCTTADGIIYLNPQVIKPMIKNPFKDETRDLPIEFPFKQKETVNVLLTLPEGWQIEDMPKPIVLKYDGITARYVYTLNEGLLSMRYQLEINRTFFSKEQYQDIKSFFDKVVENNNSIITLKKLP